MLVNIFFRLNTVKGNYGKQNNKLTNLDYNNTE